MLIFASLFAAYTRYAGHPSLAMVGTAAVTGALGGMVSLVVHELGHVHAARRTHGVRPIRVSVIALGAATHLEGAYRTGRDQMRVAISGPVASFALAVLLVAGIALPLATSFRWALFLLAGLNVTLGLAALLPIHPLDGHKAIVGLIWAVLKSERKARSIIRRLGMIAVAADLAAGSMLLLERPKLGCVIATLAVAILAEKRFAHARQCQLT